MALNFLANIFYEPFDSRRKWVFYRKKATVKAITWYRNYWLRSATTISAMVDFWSSLSQDWDLDKSPLFGLSFTFLLLLKREVEEMSYIVAFLTQKAKRTIKHST